MTSADFHVVVRSCGERTTQSVCGLLQDFWGDCWSLIDAQPFEETLRRCYSQGIEAGMEFTVTIDADVLPTRKGILELLSQMQSMPSETFEIHGHILDHAFQGPRQGGVRIYRTQHLPFLLNNVPGDGEQHRPEAFVVAAATAQGLKSEIVPTVSGIHGFFQAYEDLFRNGFVLAQKYRWLLPELTELWRRLRPVDPGFRFLLLGASMSQHTDGKSLLDRSQFPQSLSQLFQLLEVEPQVEQDTVTEQDVTAILNNFEQVEEAKRVEQIRSPGETGPLGPWHTFRRHGLRSLLWFSGRVLDKAAQKLMTVSRVSSDEQTG